MEELNAESDSGTSSSHLPSIGEGKKLFKPRLSIGKHTPLQDNSYQDSPSHKRNNSCPNPFVGDGLSEGPERPRSGRKFSVFKGRNITEDLRRQSGDVPNPHENMATALAAKTVQERMDLDDLLPHVGEFGRYQKFFFWFICLPACIPCGFHSFNQLFMAPDIDHWCKIPELESLANLTDEERRSVSVPLEDGHRYSRCRMFDYNYSAMVYDTGGQWNEMMSWGNQSDAVACRHGWKYNQSVYASTVVADWDLVCGKRFYPTIALSVLNIGGIIGVYFFGVISDRWGRRVSFFTCLAVEQIAGLLTAFAPEFISWTILRFFVGLTIPAIYQIPFIIALELVGPSYRTFATVMTCLFYTVGLLMFCGVAYVVRDWVLLAVITSVPFFFYFVFWWFLPESPRWLLARGRLEEAARILETLSIVNKKPLPQTYIRRLKERIILQQTQSNWEIHLSISSLFQTPNMRKKTLLITFNWFANATVYVGLSYYGPSLGSNEYASFFLSCAVEIPSYLLMWGLMDRWGRRWPLSFFMILGGICCICTVLLPPEAEIAVLVLYLLSKFSISASYLVLYPFAGELYPTEIRGIGIGFSSYVGGLGLVVIPFINYLGLEFLILPLVIMGAVAILGGVSSLLLPETLHNHLPQTLEEGEQFGKNWEWKDLFICIPIKPNAQYEDLDTYQMRSFEIPKSINQERKSST